jgi:hypothetical protein
VPEADNAELIAVSFESTSISLNDKVSSGIQKRETCYEFTEFNLSPMHTQEVEYYEAISAAIHYAPAELEECSPIES